MLLIWWHHAASHMRGMKRLAALMMVPALLAGCAQGPTLDQRLSTFVGLGEAELVSALGVPVRVHEAEGRRFLQFEQRRNVAVAPAPGFYGPAYGPWGPRYGYWPAPPGIAELRCELTFTLREGRVETFTYRGQGCG
ncbi:hypothetical protein HB662_06245 [Roseomonas frigidaquae]|uniref:Uncharacterized protein n=1 Tax=Falsiroseomonas frigidaquae TaxID=487318 RepID=A0ABX1EUZ2_9PROT|nr:hypothetical protein [Falsiroseomonas frigidaquae]NKE44370.1 hypothetical protein [Falsiroseomonas frigidaquae]